MSLKCFYVIVRKNAVKQNVQLCVDSSNRTLTFLEPNGSEETFLVQDVFSLEFCFHETVIRGSMVFEAVAVLKFSCGQILSGSQISAGEPVILTLSAAFKDFLYLQEIVIKYESFLSEKVVRLLPFTKFPDCVKEIIPLFAHCYTNEYNQRLRQDKLGQDKVQQAMNNLAVDDVIALESDDEEMTVVAHSSSAYFLILGEKIQISNDGFSSMAPKQWLNDEIINISLKFLQAKYPNVHVFDTYTTDKICQAFLRGTYESNFKMSNSDFDAKFGKMFLTTKGDRRDQNELFFSKKMLLFPICHKKHWVMLVVVNPLLSDITHLQTNTNENHKATAYFIDSLKGTKKYTSKMLAYRVSLLWKCVMSFLRLAGYYHTFVYITPKLFEVTSDNNFPSQRNNFDCGCNMIVNAYAVVEKYDELMTGSRLTVSEEKIASMKETVFSYREHFKNQLDSYRIKP